MALWRPLQECVRGPQPSPFLQGDPKPGKSFWVPRGLGSPLLLPWVPSTLCGFSALRASADSSARVAAAPSKSHRPSSWSHLSLFPASHTSLLLPAPWDWARCFSSAAFRLGSAPVSNLLAWLSDGRLPPRGFTASYPHGQVQVARSHYGVDRLLSSPRSHLLMINAPCC